MARTAPAPAPTHDDLDIEDVTHLVCSCRLGPDGIPLELPVHALCGWPCEDDAPSFTRKLCTMCVEQAATVGCTNCGGSR